MQNTLVATLPWFIAIAKKQEFPDSVFAVETITDILWQIASENGDVDPAQSVVVSAHCEIHGFTYEQILDLSTQTLKKELNLRLSDEKQSVQDILFALCMVYADKLNQSDSEVIYVDWFFWNDFSSFDMVQFPADRVHFLTEIPYPILNRLVQHFLHLRSNFDLANLISEIEFRMKQIYETYEDKFVVQRLGATTV